MPTPLEKFQSLLRELFQFEQADLDFGVYRIMNLRRERMQKWLTEELPARAKSILTEGGQTADDDLASRLEQLKQDLLGIDPGGIDEDGNIVNEALKGVAKGKDYLKVKEQYDRAPARTAAGLEPLVYNHLYDFFSRYYDTGDFIPRRRRSFAPDGRDTYAIPWDGEEVVLHWANKDQYYIKTGDRFTHYRWQSQAGERTFTVEFRLTDADLPANNNKDAKKKFNLLVTDKVEWQEDKSTLVVPFHHRGLTPEEERQLIGTQEAKLRESIIKRTVDTLCQLPAVSGVPQLATALMAPKRDAAGQEKRDKDGNAVPLLPHHLSRWAVKNESDFFIHKDLRRFLSGELDYFLKSAVLNLDNLLAAGEQRAEPNYRLLHAVKRLGAEIVDFVSQLEDFQKALFEKKKFVLETSWCLTLDRIPASVKEDVYAAILANDRQWEEWETLYKISQWPADLVTAAPRTEQFLNANPTLMIDTRHFEADLTESILQAIESLDDKTDGVLFNSENFQALSLLKARYREQLKCIYIDPPYNVPGSEILYKNQFLHSSWLALIQDRLRHGLATLSPGGVTCVTIDDYEKHRLLSLVDSLEGAESVLGVVCIRNNPSGRATVKGFAVNHEYAVFLARAQTGSGLGRFRHSEEQRARYDLKDENGAPYELENMRKSSAGSLRRDRATQFFAFFVNVDSLAIRLPRQTWNEPLRTWELQEQPQAGEEIVYPVSEDNLERCWSIGIARARNELTTFVAERAGGRVEIYKRKYLNLRGILPRTWWDKVEYSARDSGTRLLRDMLGRNQPFDFPKAVAAVEDCLRVCGLDYDDTALDFFAGSGTTGHAVINLNREDGEGRKFVLVEMGNYFDTVLLPRLKKATFTPEWNDGKPARLATREETERSPGIMKVVRLESYEDSLDNIEFNSSAAPGAELGLDFRRDYELRYALDWESKDCPTRLAVEQLDTPFDYTLILRRESGTVTVKPDLPETFAYLIGLHTLQRFRTERDGVSYLIYTGTLNEDGTEVAVLWRTCKGWTEANLTAEMDWWREQHETIAPGATRVYVNGASAIRGHHSLDAEFKNRMHGSSVA